MASSRRDQRERAAEGSLCDDGELAFNGLASHPVKHMQQLSTVQDVLITFSYSSPFLPPFSLVKQTCLRWLSFYDREP